MIFTDLVHDVRYAIRGLKSQPGFTTAAVLTLALGIGANTAVFSLLNAVLLRTLPLASAGQLYFVAHGTTEEHSTSSNYPFLERIRSHTEVFAGTAAYTTNTFKVSSGDAVEMVSGEYVSGSYHAVVGAPIALGRGFTSEDDRVPGASAYAVISDGYWTRRFGRSTDVIGRTLIVDGRSVTVIGVTAAGFTGLLLGRPADVTLPLSMMLIDEPEFLNMHDGWRGMPLVVRLKPGVDERQAAALVNAVFEQYMSEPENRWARERSPDAFRAALLLPASRGSYELRTMFGTALKVLMAMVGLFLLIAVINLANLFLVRQSARERETAVRLSLGAKPGHIIREWLAESILLAVSGGALALLLAEHGTRLAAAMFRAAQPPLILDVRPDAVVFAFTAAVSLLTGFAFGIIPAVSAARVSVTPALQGGRSIAGPRRTLVRNILLASQVALCVVLVFGAGLFVRTLRNLTQVETGFARQNLLLFGLDAGGTTFQAQRLPALCTDLLERLRGQRGMRAGACSTTSPLDTERQIRGLNIPELPPTPEARGVWVNVISADYFTTMGIRLLRGRPFSRDDTATSEKVAIVNDTMARHYFGGKDPIGQTITFMSAPRDVIRIVGIAEDSRERLRDRPPRMVYTVLPQIHEPTDRLTAAIRTDGDAEALTASVRAETAALSRDVAVTNVRTMEQQMASALTRERLLAALAGSFGVLALVLACVGVYGVVSYQTAHRTREIGIRLALGAEPHWLLRLFLARTLIVAAVGTSVGVAAALGAASVLPSLLFDVSTRDPVSLAATTGLLLTTSVFAAYLPARRAARMDPLTALRYE